MNNPGTQEALSTRQDETTSKDKRNHKTENNKDEQHELQQKTEMNPVQINNSCFYYKPGMIELVYLLPEFVASSSMERVLDTS